MRPRAPIVLLLLLGLAAVTLARPAPTLAAGPRCRLFTETVSPDAPEVVEPETGGFSVCDDPQGAAFALREPAPKGM